MAEISKYAKSFLKSIGLDIPSDQFTPMIGTGDEDFDAYAKIQGEIAAGDKTFEEIASVSAMSPDKWRSTLTEETYKQGGYTPGQWADVKLDVAQKAGKPKPEPKDDPEPEQSADDILEEEEGPSAEQINQWMQEAWMMRDGGQINQATFNAFIEALNSGIWPGTPEWPKEIEDPPVVQGGPGAGGINYGGSIPKAGEKPQFFGDPFGLGQKDMVPADHVSNFLGMFDDGNPLTGRMTTDERIQKMVDYANKTGHQFTTEEWQRVIGYDSSDMPKQPSSLDPSKTPQTDTAKAAEIAADEERQLNTLSQQQLIKQMQANAPDWFIKAGFPASAWPPQMANPENPAFGYVIDWGKIREYAQAFDPQFGVEQAKQMEMMERKQQIESAQTPALTAQSQFMQIPGMNVGIPVMRNPDGTISQINVPTLDKQIDRAIITGDSNRARQLIGIRDMPSATEKLNLALQIAQSPADAFQVSRLAGGEQMDRFGQAAPYLQNAIQDIFGPTSDPFRNMRAQPGGPYGFYGGMLPPGIDMQQLQNVQQQGDPQVNQMLSQMEGYQEPPAVSGPTISPEAMALAQGQGQRQFPTQMSIGPDGTATPFNFEGYTEPGAVGSMYQGSMAGQPLDYGQQGMGGATTSNDIRNTLTQGDERFGGGGFAVDPEMEAWKRAQGGQATDLGRQLSQAGYGWLANQNKSSFGPNRVAPTQATYNAPPVSQSMYNTQNTGFKAGDTVGGLPVRVGNPLLEGTPVDRPSSLFSTLGLRVPSMQATQNWLPEEKQLAESYVKGLGIDPARLWDEVQIGTPGGGMKPGIRWKESFLD